MVRFKIRRAVHANSMSAELSESYFRGVWMKDGRYFEYPTSKEDYEKYEGDGTTILLTEEQFHDSAKYYTNISLIMQGKYMYLEDNYGNEVNYDLARAIYMGQRLWEDALQKEGEDPCPDWIDPDDLKQCDEEIFKRGYDEELGVNFTTGKKLRQDCKGNEDWY